MTNWYDLLQEATAEDGEDFGSCRCTLDESELRRPFDDGHGVEEGRPFTAWGKRWVYFPICYDGAEWVGHAPRHPCDISMKHQGWPR